MGDEVVEVKRRSLCLLNDGRACCNEALVDDTNNEDCVWKQALLCMEMNTLR